MIMPVCFRCIGLTALLTVGAAAAPERSPRAYRVSEAGLPIAAGAEVPTSARAATNTARVIRGLLLRDLDALTAPGETREAIRRLLERAAAFYARAPDAPAAEALEREAAALVGDGREQPLACYVLGTVADQAERYDEAKRWLLRAAVFMLDHEQVSNFRKAQLCARLARIYKSHRFVHENLQRIWSYRSIEWMNRTLASNEVPPEALRFLAQHIAYYWDWGYYRPNASVTDAALATNRPQDWLTIYLRGLRLKKQAWEARGGGFVDQVTPAGWEAFGERLQEAGDQLRLAWEQHPEWPEAAAAMIGVAMAGGARPDESPRLWFDRAVAAEFDYLPAYADYAWSLRPRWGGSHDEMYAFGLACLATHRFDTEVPRRFLISLVDIEADEAGAGRWTQAGTFSLLKDLFDGYLALAPTGRQARVDQTLLTAAAWRCQAYEAAAGGLARLGADFDEEVAREYFQVTRAMIQDDVIRARAPWAAELRAADALLADDPATARGRYAGLQARPDAQAPTLATLLADRVQTATLLERYRTGQWTELLPALSFDSWLQRAGTWSRTPEGVIIGMSSPGGLALEFPATFSGDLEVEAELELGPTPYPPHSNAGVMLVPVDSTNRQALIAVLVNGGDRTVSIGPGLRGRERADKIAPVATRNRLLVRMEGRALTAILNDRPIFERVEQTTLDVGSPWRLRLGGYYWYGDAGIRCHALRVRRLLPTR